MEFKQAFDKLENSSKFKDWKKSNKAYLSYALFISNKDEEKYWQIGYYDEKTDKMTTFVVNGNIEIKPEEEIFKKEDTKVKQIELNKVKLSFSKILENASKFQKDKHKPHTPVKIISILQNLENFGNIWNITYITETFKTLNMKISAEDGRIIEDKLTSILDFKQ